MFPRAVSGKLQAAKPMCISCDKRDNKCESKAAKHSRTVEVEMIDLQLFRNSATIDCRCSCKFNEIMFSFIDKL